MDAAGNRLERTSRWTRHPVLEQGSPVSACLTERDIVIFKLLARYRYLPADDIHAFVGGNFIHLTRRLNLLQRKPNCYLNRPHQQRINADANHRRLIYELDVRGARILQDLGLPFLAKSYHRNFVHELMVCRIMASIELGAHSDPSLRLISWSEILGSPNTPLATRNAAQPERVPACFELHGETCQADIAADGFPFGIQRAGDGKPTFLFFPGIEADCGTEPVDTNDIERASIYKKLSAYLSIVEQGIHRSHFGFPNFFIPFITTSTSRMTSIMTLLSRITGGKGAKIILFKTFPTLTSFEKPAPPTGHMLTEPWQRVGFGPFSFAN